MHLFVYNFILALLGIQKLGVVFNLSPCWARPLFAVSVYTTKNHGRGRGSRRKGGGGGGERRGKARREGEEEKREGSKRGRRGRVEGREGGVGEGEGDRNAFTNTLNSYHRFCKQFNK